jgi:ribosomal protein L22
MSDATPTDPPEGTEAEEQTAAADAGKAAKAAKADKPAAKAKEAKAKDAKAGEPKAEPKAKAAKAKDTKAKDVKAKADAGDGEKAPAKTAPAKDAAEDEPAQGEPQAAGRSATKKRGAKKAASAKAAAPGDAAEAQEVAKAHDAEKPASKVARAAAASVKGPSRRRVVRAHARYVRTSARKARMVCGHIRGKSVQEARAILAFTPREVARDWSKLLESAVANAESNHELLEDDLIVREAYADEGPTIKRFRPRAMGRATPIRKRTSHLTITLSPRPEPGTTKKNR